MVLFWRFSHSQTLFVDIFELPGSPVSEAVKVRNFSIWRKLSFEFVFTSTVPCSLLFHHVHKHLVALSTIFFLLSPVKFLCTFQMKDATDEIVYCIVNFVRVS